MKKLMFSVLVVSCTVGAMAQFTGIPFAIGKDIREHSEKQPMFDCTLIYSVKKADGTNHKKAFIQQDVEAETAKNAEAQMFAKVKAMRSNFAMSSFVANSIVSTLQLDAVACEQQK
jgi:alpha-galactosidase